MKKIYLLFILLFFFYNSLYAKFDTGIGLFYSNYSVKESKKDNNTSYYFQENESSKQSNIGINLFIYKVINTGKYFNLSIGPNFDIGKLNNHDTQPDGLDGEGNILFGLGIDFKLTLKAVPTFKPFVKIGINSRWTRTDWKAEPVSPYFSGNISYTENSTGINTDFLFGIEYHFTKQYKAFFQAGVILGSYSSTIDSSYSDIIPPGNRYNFIGFTINCGAALNFSIRGR